MSRSRCLRETRGVGLVYEIQVLEQQLANSKGPPQVRGSEFNPTPNLFRLARDPSTVLKSNQSRSSQKRFNRHIF